MSVLEQNVEKLTGYLARFKAGGIMNRIGGADRQGSAGVFQLNSPVDKSIICDVARGGEADIDEAAAAAAASFPAWRDMPAIERREILLKVADAIEARAEEIALCECWDTGQTIRFMSKAALRGAENFRYFADQVVQARDGQHLKSPTLMNVTTRVPVGPVGVITPWNTPFMLSTWKITPALASGCTVVHKPAEDSPLSARLLVEIAEEAGLPKGVLNTVNGFGHDAGKRLTEHPAIRAIAFVGESRTGSMITRQGADTLKRMLLELGGKNPVIVFEDADLERALDAVIFMIYSINGERCTSSSRLLVQESIREAVAASGSKVLLLASGSLSHKMWANKEYAANNGTFTISSEFNRQMDLRVLDMWKNSEHDTFLKMLGDYAELCDGEGGMHDTAMLYGALGWDSYTGKCEVVTEYFPSSGTGQTNVIFPVQ